MYTKSLSILENIKLKKAFKLSKIKNAVFVKNIDGGMSNKTLLFDSEKGKCVVHISTKNYELFVDRKHEYCFHFANLDSKIVQEPIYLDDFIRIYKFVEGSPLNILNYKEHLESVAKVMRDFHNLEKSPYDYNPFDYIRMIEVFVSEEKDNLFNESMNILLENKEVLESREKVICHNDFQMSNIIITENGDAKVIDMEFAANNDYLFDLAAFGNSDFDDSIELLSVYNPVFTEEDIKIMSLWRIYLNSLWYLVALKKKEMGYDKILNLDFKAIGLNFLNRNKKIIESINSRLKSE